MATVKNSRANGLSAIHWKKACISDLTWVWAGGLQVGLRGFAALVQGLRLEQLQPERGVEAMDLLHVQLAHERDRLGVDHLPRHHDREAGRVRDHEVRR